MVTNDDDGEMQIGGGKRSRKEGYNNKGGFYSIKYSPRKTQREKKARKNRNQSYTRCEKPT